ncbi:helix-turn-helix domain-containing protein [Aquipseudomonas alcaligenes]|uniref:helix-turn-helix domain-containing protein n=1 Tax=Aquipseudomonas alcaligenes TaxID=43263 RepID=UPI0016590A91|nr:helix-turn-helix transcriptional regulator [Pseudomonas alcaligenes]
MAWLVRAKCAFNMHIMTQRLNAAAAQNLGLRIREARINRGLTLTELGFLTNVHHSQLSRAEQGRFSLVSKNISAACTFLQISPQAITSDLPEHLIARVKHLVTSSPSHARVLERILDALEELPLASTAE